MLSLGNKAQTNTEKLQYHGSLVKWKLHAKNQLFLSTQNPTVIFSLNQNLFEFSLCKGSYRA